MMINVKNIFRKRVRVSDDLRLAIPRHFVYTTFGVRGRYDSVSRTGNYICSGEPGTGFFAHSSDSSSYRHFIASERKKLKQNYLTLLMDKEPDLQNEYDRIEKVLEDTHDKEKLRILSTYQNVVALARDEEMLQRVVRAIKDYIKRNHRSQANSSILTHYKSSIASLEHDVRATQLNIKNDLNEEQLAAWGEVVKAFDDIVNSRRIWSVYMDGETDAYQQVFFDLGIFDYIQSPFDTPLIRDHQGRRFYLYPQGIVEARTNTDFDIHHWNKMKVSFNPTDISTLSTRAEFNFQRSSRKKHHTDALSNLYGTTRSQTVGELAIPTLKLRFYVNHVEPVDAFVKVLIGYLEKYGDK
ncbi:MAG: DUF4236 domain-containing protein [Bacteroidales bacterium]|nr:DUF4236 domain-containing protein [Bacteroidales bacterium]